MSVDLIFQDFDDVEPSYGFSDEPLPTGWYPVKVEKIHNISTTKGGAHQVRMQLQVLHGDCANKRAFVSMNMSAAETNHNGTNRSAEELKNVSRSIQGQMSGFLKSIGVTTGAPVGESDSDKLASFFSVSEWEGKELMAYVKLRPAKGQYSASNMLNSYKHIDDPKKGLAAWLAGGGGSASTATTSAATAVEI